MFDTLLIANRGEIACRIIATARAKGLATVAVYSDVDKNAPHVAIADCAVCLGPAPVAESYLNIPAILEAARATGAQAIHPGYGFLSENPAFVEAVDNAGLIFVGPPAAAIRKMGLKDAAKSLMSQSGVPVVPGCHDGNQDPDHLARAAQNIGYPVLIKARAGGGGKGMRLVETADDFAQALASAQREGQAAFGDPAVLIEKFITTPRHIEMQIMADSHGTVVHLFERDCSLQRRHQKVIEEVPAPGMTETLRAAMGKAACDAARAIGYVGAGTVEFIVDGTGALTPDGFWFMEMNTRLQVEHPVTEAITGLDLVALQLDVARGLPLPFTQDDLTIDGHAVEARLYAEDATEGFLPATGTLTHLGFPAHAAFGPGDTRVDAGVRAGDPITPHYDPMIAKVICHGPDRATALARLTATLSATEVAGTVTNLGFLARLSAHDGFRQGRVDTGLIARNQADLIAPAPADRALACKVAALTALDLPRRVATGDPWQDLAGWRIADPATQTVRLILDGAAIEQTVTGNASTGLAIDDVPVQAARDANRLTLTVDGVTQACTTHVTPDTITVFRNGDAFAFARPDPLDQDSTTGENGDDIRAPMPGLVTKIVARPGEPVEKGQTLLILEAMKMEHSLTAPRDGRLAEVLTAEGAQVENGAVLIRLESVPP